MADKPPPSAPYSIVPLDAGRWHLFEGLAGRHNGVLGGCWGTSSHPAGPERGQGAEANRSLKRCYVDAGRAHAALVVDGDEAGAWGEYGTPGGGATIHHRAQH